MYIALLIPWHKSLLQQLVDTRVDVNLIRARKYQAWRLKLRRIKRATRLESCSLTFHTHSLHLGIPTSHSRTHAFLDAFAEMRKAAISFVMCLSVLLPAWDNSAPTGRIFTKFCIWVFFRKTSEKNQVSLKSEKNNCTLRNDQYTFFMICCSVLLKMRNISDKSCIENKKTRFMFNNFF